MVFKRYIKRDGKVFGPYFYESKRVDGKVISKYKGSAKEDKKESELVKTKNKNCKELEKGNKVVKCKNVAAEKARNIDAFNVDEFINPSEVSKPLKEEKIKKTARKEKRTYIAKPMASTREMLDEFNRRLIEIGKTITFGEVETSVGHYDEMVKLYNKMKNKLPYEDSVKLFNAIKRVYEDLEELRATELL